ncbi:MAG TPA: biotin/lipoyl-binding protein, partial [Gemmataceae bacterium]|nr:biotin/lipoyl-binding protein [Gemmataceae bacterium]
MKTMQTFSWSIKVVGLVVLAASFAGVALLLHPRANGSNPEPTPATESPTRVICFGHVDVEDGVAALYPLQPGQVREIIVKEGAAVHARDILLRLDRRQAEFLVRQAQADLEGANMALKQARRMLQLQPTREAEQQAVIDAATARLRAAEAVLGRRQEVGNLAGSAKETEAARAQRDEVQAVLRGEQKKLEELRLNDPNLTVARAQANVAAKKAQLDQARLVLEQCDLRAPADGTVLRVLVKPG